MTWYWHDRGDLHGATITVLDGPEDTVKDSDFAATGLGEPYDIKISWTPYATKTEWRCSKPEANGRYVIVEHVGGWPGPGGEHDDNPEDKGDSRE